MKDTGRGFQHALCLCFTKLDDEAIPVKLGDTSHNVGSDVKVFSDLTATARQVSDHQANLQLVPNSLLEMASQQFTARAVGLRPRKRVLVRQNLVGGTKVGLPSS